MEEKRFVSFSFPLSSLVSGFWWRTEGRHFCGLLVQPLSHPHPLWEQLDLLAFGWAVNAGTRSPCYTTTGHSGALSPHVPRERGRAAETQILSVLFLAVPLERTLYLSLVNLYKSKGRDHMFPSEALLWVLPYPRTLFPTSTLFRGGRRAAILYLARPCGWLPELRNWAHTFAVSVCDSRWQPLCRGEDGLG